MGASRAGTSADLPLATRSVSPTVVGSTHTIIPQSRPAGPSAQMATSTKTAPTAPTVTGSGAKQGSQGDLAQCSARLSSTQQTRWQAGAHHRDSEEGIVSQEVLPKTCKGLFLLLNKAFMRPGVVAQAFNPSTWEAEARGAL